MSVDFSKLAELKKKKGARYCFLISIISVSDICSCGCHKTKVFCILDVAWSPVSIRITTVSLYRILIKTFVAIINMFHCAKYKLSKQ